VGAAFLPYRELPAAARQRFIAAGDSLLGGQAGLGVAVPKQPRRILAELSIQPLCRGFVPQCGQDSAQTDARQNTFEKFGGHQFRLQRQR
jgi:hypothetical protein